MAEQEPQSTDISTPGAGAEKVQISVYVPREIAESARDAVIATSSYGKGYRSLSELVSEAMAEKIARLEKQFNNGRQFPGRTRELHAGRPLG